MFDTLKRDAMLCALTAALVLAVATPSLAQPTEAQKAGRRFSQRQFVECLRAGAQRFGWNTRSRAPGQLRDGRWLVGMGVAAAFRNNMVVKSAARVRLDHRGIVTVETDMTEFNKKYTKGSVLFVVLLIYEVPIVCNFLMSGAGAPCSLAITCGAFGPWIWKR